MAIRHRISTVLICCALLTSLLAAQTTQTPAASSSSQAGGAQQADPSKAQRTGKEGDEDPQNVAPQQPAKQQPAAKPPAKENPKKAGKGAKKDDPQAEAKKEEPAKPADPFSSGTFNGLKLRLIGPALTSGRVGALAVNPRNKAHYYVGANSGGVWRTDNAGTTWTPVFDREGSYSIGYIAMDPDNPSVVWVGTGEDNAQRSVAYGDGIYKTEDGGKSWKNMGLKTSEHIGRIIIDPRDSNTLYVAVPGPLWGPGGDRGVFKTKDGGKTWKNVLFVDEHTGASDIVQDPRDPDVLYAGTWQRRRHVFTMIDGGPGGGIWKSTDGGETWAKLKSGLPTVDIGRIGLAIPEAAPDMVYALVEAADKKGGLFRSTDRGATWEKRGDWDSTGMYYQKIYADPKNPERVYLPHVFNMVSHDGGKTIVRLGEKSKHVDNHVLWIDPDNTDYLLVGSDGGVYESWDRGQNWHYKANLPITQFYQITADNSKPFYYVYGGTQDNYSLGGPSQTRNISGISNADWFITNGGDGFRSVVDPEDPNTVYAESQYGGLVRFDRRTGERVGIQPIEPKGAAPHRWNWDSPLVLSPHQHTRLYFASNILYKSEDRGNSWKAISGDLSRQLDRDKIPVMGRIWGPDAVAKHASTSFFGNIVALSESPKQAGLLYAGTDDGLIQISENDGGAWTKIEKFPGVPDVTYVSELLASQHDVNVVYATFNNHKNADFKPYVLKSTDKGRTWTSITANLPAHHPVWAIAEDHVNPNLLFVGTEFGLFFSNDGGGKWVQLKGGGFPTIAVRDLYIQKRENDLVVGTFGRGIYILDDLTPLRTTRPESLQQAFASYPVKQAWLYIPSSAPLGGSGKGFMGESFYTAENAPYGATFTYYMKEKIKSRKERRQEAEAAAIKKNETLVYPSKEDMRAEELEEAPEIQATITDEAGNVVRKLSATNAAGLNRVTWNLRYSEPNPITNLAPPPPPEFPWSQASNADLVMPGTYTVSFAKKVEGKWTDLGQKQTFTVAALDAQDMPAADRKVLVAFQQKLARLYIGASGAVQAGNNAKLRLDTMERALNQTPNAPRALADRIDALQLRLDGLMNRLRGDNLMRARQENTPSSIFDRVQGAVYDQRFSSQPPTQTSIDSYNVAADEFTEVLAQLRQLIDTDIGGMEKELDKLGAPWTPGRLPSWTPEP